MRWGGVSYWHLSPGSSAWLHNMESPPLRCSSAGLQISFSDFMPKLCRVYLLDRSTRNTERPLNLPLSNNLADLCATSPQKQDSVIHQQQKLHPSHCLCGFEASRTSVLHESDRTRFTLLLHAVCVTQVLQPSFSTVCRQKAWLPAYVSTVLSADLCVDLLCVPNRCPEPQLSQRA